MKKLLSCVLICVLLSGCKSQTNPTQESRTDSSQTSGSHSSQPEETDLTQKVIENWSEDKYKKAIKYYDDLVIYSESSQSIDEIISFFGEPDNYEDVMNRDEDEDIKSFSWNKVNRDGALVLDIFITYEYDKYISDKHLEGYGFRRKKLDEDSINEIKSGNIYSKMSDIYEKVGLPDKLWGYGNDITYFNVCWWHGEAELPDHALVLKSQEGRMPVLSK